MDLYAHLYTNHSLHGQCPLYVDPFSVDRVYVTERVPVPSSNHVAEIVGKLGCKIKALQAITNTYIKTPVRGKDPVFIVAGRKQAVEIAKQEILAAADHFTIIRAKTNGISGTNQRPPKLPGHVTRWVSVPYHLVGLVVGTKGATIKWIQQNTGTYIVTPHRDKYPVFEVTGLPENIVQVRERIKMYLTMRTGYKVDVYLVNNFNCIGRDVYRHLPRDGSDNLLDKMPNREQAIGVRLPTQGYFSLSSTNYSLSSAAHGSGSAAHACPTDSSSSVDQHKNEHICIVCEETEVSTVHLPCGHCLFCMDCAMLICQLVRPECPACHTPATQAIQISA